MPFIIQIKDGPRSKWRDNRYARRYPDIQSAIAGARSLDQDGFFSSSVRVVDQDGKVAATAFNYRDILLAINAGLIVRSTPAPSAARALADSLNKALRGDNR